MKKIDIQSLLNECSFNPTGDDVAKWIEWQKGVVSLLYKNLEREKSRLAEVIGWYGEHTQRYRPKITYSIIRNLDNPHSPLGSIEYRYNQEWTWKEKLLYILNWEGRPLTIVDFVNVLKDLDHNYGHVSNPNNTVAVYLRRLVMADQLIRYKIPKIRAGYYAHHSWFDEQGKLKDEFRKKGFI